MPSPRTKYYLLIIYDGVEADIEGPYRSEERRDAAALKIRKEQGKDHGLHALDVVNGKPRVFNYLGGFFPDEDEDGEDDDKPWPMLNPWQRPRGDPRSTKI
jgi:hypothetical protein